MADQIIINQGATFDIAVYCERFDPLETNFENPTLPLVAFDLTGFTGRSHIRRRHSSESFTEFTVTKSATPTDGWLYLRLVPTQTRALGAASYVGDVEIEEDGNPDNVIRVAEMGYLVKAEVTRVTTNVVPEV